MEMQTAPRYEKTSVNFRAVLRVSKYARIFSYSQGLEEKRNAALAGPDIRFLYESVVFVMRWSCQGSE